MRIKPVEQIQGKPKSYPISFGIYKGHYKTQYGEYMWGYYKNYKIEVYDASKYDQKLIYVSDNKLLKWIKSKLTYIQNGVKRITKSSSI